MHPTILTILALHILFTLAAADTENNLLVAPNQVSDVHPYCRCHRHGCQPYTRGIVDLTAALRTASDIPQGACIFNPALVKLGGNIFVAFTRVYVAATEERRCIPGRLDRPPFMDAWNGTLANMLAVLRIRRKRPGGRTSVTLLGHRYLAKINYEDGRLFRDQSGLVFLYLAIPFGKYGGDRASVNTVLRVYVSCKQLASLHCDPELGHPRLLRYDKSLAWEKNWVPWNGTSLMSYSHYGPFGPHSVFNWSSYREPVPHARFISASNQTFFSTFSATFGKLIHLSGGTPAILETSGQSYIAVGHLRVHPGCLHPHSIPGLEQLIGNGTRTNCAHMLNLPADLKTEIPFRSFMYRRADGNMSKHYHVDYAFFFYRFSAAPPYDVTHMSHGILPPSEGHFGIVFPSGLERLGSDFIVSYGDADQAAKLMLIKQADINKLLVPLPDLEKRIAAYSVCTLPFINRDSAMWITR